MLTLMSFSPTNFGRYISQTEQGLDEQNGINEWLQQPSSTVNEIPSLMSISTVPPSTIITTNIPQKTTLPSTIITDDVELVPIPQHGPGPIQRPNKLTCPPVQQQQQQQTSSSYFTNSIQSPGTPDVLDHINRLLDHQNGSTTEPTLVTATSNPTSASISSTIINDLTTPNIPWTSFPPTEWSSKYDSSWPLTTIQSPTVSLTTQIQNPFALMSTGNEQQRQAPREESNVWSSLLGTITPRSTSSSTRTLRASTWNDLFSSAVPSATETTKPINNSWFKSWPAPDPSSADIALPNGHEPDTNNSFWDMSALASEHVVSPSIQNQQPTIPATWWSNSSSDENNNNNQSNQLSDDTTNKRDQSRWDFAR